MLGALRKLPSIADRLNSVSKLDQGLLLKYCLYVDVLWLGKREAKSILALTKLCKNEECFLDGLRRFFPSHEPEFMDLVDLIGDKVRGQTLRETLTPTRRERPKAEDIAKYDTAIAEASAALAVARREKEKFLSNFSKTPKRPQFQVKMQQQLRSLFIYSLLAGLMLQLLLSSYDDCPKCIIDSSYGWCTDPDFNEERCFLLDGGGSNKCNNVVKFNDLQVNPLVDFNVNGTKISPQKFRLSNLKPGISTKIKSTIDVPKTLPLDIYIVIDSSESMEIARNKLVDDLSGTIDRFPEIGASSIRIGIGLFFDKKYPPVMARTPYEFEHYISLTGNKTFLHEKLLKLKTEKELQSNNDNPESPYTSILQAAVCRDKIGWLPGKQSIKMIFAATDDFPKTAGDGRPMGIVNKYKNVCNLDDSGGYQQFTDYPDDNILSQVLNENDIQLTFLITQGTKVQYYQQIANNLKDISVNVIFVENSDDVVDAINDASKMILSKITIIPPASDKYTDIIVKPLCREMKISSSGYFFCPNNGAFDVEIDISANECFLDDQLLSHYITIVGYGTIEIELSTGCTCNCADPTHSSFKRNSDQCSSHGNLVCGKCYCEKSYSGKLCKCHESTSNCVKPGDQASLICSGIGRCKCNECSCGESNTKLFSGDYCECDNSNCQSGLDEFCSGPTHGTCDCGNCRCLPQYSGTLCEVKNCTNDYWKSSCTTTGSRDIRECNGRGQCECGKCRCHYGFSGDFCETEINTNTCNKYSKCALCKIHHGRPTVRSEDCSLCDDFATFTIEKIEQPKKNYECVTSFDNCDTYFLITSENNTLTTTATKVKRNIIIKPLNRKKDCKPRFSPLIMILIIVSGIILAALVLIFVAWFIKYQYDKAQYNKFRSEAANPHGQTEMNPLFDE